MKLSISSLSDWVNGKSVPASPTAVRYLVGFLQELAVRRGGRLQMSIDAWMGLHAEARRGATAGRVGRRPRHIERLDLPVGPERELRDLLYQLYLQAGAPSLTELESRIEAWDDLPGAPKRDTIHRAISGRLLPTLLDALTVAAALARIAGVDPAAIADHVRALWVAATTAVPATQSLGLGRPIDQCHPLELEVHRAIALPDRGVDLPVLPPYVLRNHDIRLQGIVDEAQAGASRMVVLVGGASTGKTRACWEAIQRLPNKWRVWHPIDPSRAAAAAQAIGEVGPYTVVWLNDTQHYLLTEDPAVSERVAAGLRTLLADPGRGPVLVLGTIWPEYWVTLTAPRPPGWPDPYAQARELLTACTTISVPDAFTSSDLTNLLNTTDPRLRSAIGRAETGRVTQYLAGAPALLDRYLMAPPAARAIMNLAIDARRFGHPTAIPYALIKHAAPGYLSDLQWDQLSDDWLDSALAYTAAPCHGMRGPLAPVRPRPGDNLTQPIYRLADYLEQVGRTQRAGIFPPASFWDAVAATVTDSALLLEIGHQAERRGRYKRAGQLYAPAATAGEVQAPADLGLLREFVDQTKAEQLYLQAADGGDITALMALARLREQAGDLGGAGDLYREAVDRGHVEALMALARLREQAGDLGGAGDLYREAVDRGHVEALMALARLREQAGDLGGAGDLYREAVDRGHVEALMALARLREQAGDLGGAGDLYREAVDRGHVEALMALARLREQAGDLGGAGDLYREAVDRGHVEALMALARLREQAGDLGGAGDLYREAVDRGHVEALMALARLREQAGDYDSAARIRQFGLTDEGIPSEPFELALHGSKMRHTTPPERTADRGALGGRRDD